MKIRLIAIAAIALSPAIVLGQTRTHHIRVSKDGSHSSTTNSTNGDVSAPSPTTTAPAAAPTEAPMAAPTEAPMAAPTTTSSDSSSMSSTPTPTRAADSSANQYGTGAAAPSPTHSQQGDSTAKMSSDSTMNNMNMKDSSTMTPTPTPTTPPTDTVRTPRSNLSVSPVDSARIGIPATRETQRADSARDTTKTPPR